MYLYKIYARSHRSFEYILVLLNMDYVNIWFNGMEYMYYII